MRWSLLGVLALLQAFVLFSAVMWWMGSSTASATANVAPQTWTGIVYDVGAAGVNLRIRPSGPTRRRSRHRRSGGSARSVVR